MPSKLNFFFIVLLVSQLFIYGYGAKMSALDTKAHQADVLSIDSIIKAIYDSITFTKGKEPKLDRLRSLFTGNAQFIRITEEGVKTMNLDSFVSSFAERIKSGKLTSFYEKEVSRKENISENIAHIFSKYVKCMNKEIPTAERSGVNSIQLFYDGKRWWICSILWEDKPVPSRQ